LTNFFANFSHNEVSTAVLLAPPANDQEADFRAYCVAHHMPMYTAEEWNKTGKQAIGLKPGEKLKPGDLYCDVP
jgi:hypothetical protein